MSNLLKYRGYHGTVDYSAEDGMLIGYVIGIRDSLNYHGFSIEQITDSFHNCIDSYLEMCERYGRSPDKEYRGSFNIRITPELHREAAIAAELAGISLNQFVQEAIEEKARPKKYGSPVLLTTYSENAVIQSTGNSLLPSDRFLPPTALSN